MSTTQNEWTIMRPSSTLLELSTGQGEKGELTSINNLKAEDNCRNSKVTYFSEEVNLGEWDTLNRCTYVSAVNKLKTPKVKDILEESTPTVSMEVNLYHCEKTNIRLSANFSEEEESSSSSSSLSLESLSESLSLQPSTPPPPKIQLSQTTTYSPVITCVERHQDELFKYYMHSKEQNINLKDQVINVQPFSEKSKQIYVQQNPFSSAKMYCNNINCSCLHNQSSGGLSHSNRTEHDTRTTHSRNEVQSKQISPFCIEQITMSTNKSFLRSCEDNVITENKHESIISDHESTIKKVIEETAATKPAICQAEKTFVLNCNVKDIKSKKIICDNENNELEKYNEINDDEYFTLECENELNKRIGDANNCELSNGHTKISRRLERYVEKNKFRNNLASTKQLIKNGDSNVTRTQKNAIMRLVSVQVARELTLSNYNELNVEITA